MRVSLRLALLTVLAACTDATDGTDATDATDADDAPDESDLPDTDGDGPAETDDVDTDACPASCDDGDACTEDTVVSGSAVTCDLVCEHRDVSSDPDLPDDAFEDANCDGVDGTVAALVFVAPDGVDAEACGTPDDPCGTLAYAMAAADAFDADVAVSYGTYPESLRVIAGVSVYGGYDRAAGWARSNATLPSLEASELRDSGVGPKLIAGVSAFGITEPTVLDHLVVRPESAPVHLPGVSVVGVWLVRSPGVSLNAVASEPGDGSPGAEGTIGGDGRTGSSAAPTAWGPSRAGRPGAPATVCELGPDAPGGAAGGQGGADDIVAACGTGAGNPPRAGGRGSCPTANPGAAGRSANNCPIPDVAVLGGGDAEVCTASPGTATRGAPASVDLGGVNSDYWAVGDGATGGVEAVGPVGYGGHGGGGGGQGDAVFCDGGGHGGGGGGGGGGGCGGLPGAGGGGGGASIGVLLVESPAVAVTASSAWAGAGGAGGRGGAGGAGGLGGEGSDGSGGAPTLTLTSSCDVLNENQDGLAGGAGGPGGAGGGGGGGGGGAGGASIGLVACDSSIVGDLDAGPGEGGTGGEGGAVHGPRGADGATLDVLDGCSLDADSVGVEVGFSRNGIYELWSPSPFGQTGQSLPAPNTCSPGFELVGSLDGDGGFWLCAPPERVASRFVVGNGDGEDVRLWTVQSGNLTDRGLSDRDGECLGRVLVWDGLSGRSQFVETWVCVEPERRVTRFGATELLTWSPQRTSVVDAVGSLRLTATAGDPWLESPKGLELDASRTTIQVTMSNETTSTQMQVFFHRIDQGGFTGDQVLSVTLPSTATPVTLVLDASTHPEWYGTIDALRFDWTDASAGSSTVVGLEARP